MLLLARPLLALLLLSLLHVDLTEARGVGAISAAAASGAMFAAGGLVDGVRYRDENTEVSLTLNKIKMINRCDLMLQDFENFKTAIMSSYKSVQSVKSVPCVHHAILSSCPLDH